jgi:hypothetical protein
MYERFLPRSLWIFLGTFAGVAFIVGLIAAVLRHDSAGDIVLSAFEASLLAFIGGLLARTFISALLLAGKDHPNVSYLLGWFFFLWPGLIDFIPRLLHKQYATRPIALLWFAATVGAFTGMMDGAWRMHNWAGLGWVAFPLDVTWGLAGTTNGDLLHVINFAWADHAVGEFRTDAHRYNTGFRVQGDFAFTQGAVMSNNDDALGAPLYDHENTHIWQNRAFGPFYSLTYIIWLLIWAIPGLIFGAASSQINAGQGAEAWSYYNNPWETWAYAVGESHGANPRVNRLPAGIWSDLAVGIVSIFYFGGYLALAIWLIYRTWKRGRAAGAT